MNKRHIFLGFMGLLCTCASMAQVPAFPGADGYGRYTKGGRGGSVYYVTTLDDGDQEGTLRYGVTKLTNATILFKVSGTIHLNSSLRISASNITIAGQSAPGDGICLADYPVEVSGNNVIVRYMRFRMGDQKLTADEADGADAFGGRFSTNVIIDHCSISWCTDECASFYANTNFTMQWCIISESLRMSLHSKGAHGYGAIWGGIGASFYHNLMIHHDSRTPRFGTGSLGQPSDHYTDMRNNVIYNWSGNGCYGAEGMNVNIINNYYKPGAATTSSTKDKFIKIGSGTSEDGTTSYWGSFFIQGNINTKYTAVNADNWNGVAINTTDLIDGKKTREDLNNGQELGEVPLLHQHTAEGCYPLVLQYAGCSKSRDAVDERLTAECKNGTYTFKGASANKGGIIDKLTDLKPADAGDDWSPWPELKSAIAPTDTDGDGIPDEWETAHGLNPNDAKDGNRRNEEGYTMLEVYLNELVEDITNGQYEGAEEVGKAGEPYQPDTKVANSSISWKMDKGTLSEIPTIESSYIKGGTMSLGDKLTLTDTYRSFNHQFTRFNVAEETKQVDEDCYLAYDIEIPDGMTFTPLSLSVSALRYGTSGGYFDAVWIDANGNRTQLSQGIHAGDPKGTSEVPEEIDFQDEKIEPTSGHGKLVFYIYKLNPTRSIGFANVLLKGYGTSTSGVEQITYKLSDKQVIYDLSGKRLGKPQKGVNIINNKKILIN